MCLPCTGPAQATPEGRHTKSITDIMIALELPAGPALLCSGRLGGPAVQAQPAAKAAMPEFAVCNDESYKRQGSLGGKLQLLSLLG
jgi:hypothetical protein